MHAFFETFSKMEILDLVLSLPVFAFLILFAAAVGISVWREDKKFSQLIRKFAFKEAESGTSVEKVMKLAMFYIVVAAILGYIGSVYFAMSIGIIAVLMTFFAFYYLAVAEQYKNGTRFE